MSYWEVIAWIPLLATGLALCCGVYRTIPAYLDDAIEKAVEIDSHISKSELVRDAVRRLLEEKGFLK